MSAHFTGVVPAHFAVHAARFLTQNALSGHFVGVSVGHGHAIAFTVHVVPSDVQRCGVSGPHGHSTRQVPSQHFVVPVPQDLTQSTLDITHDLSGQRSGAEMGHGHSPDVRTHDPSAEHRIGADDGHF